MTIPVMIDLMSMVSGYFKYESNRKRDFMDRSCKSEITLIPKKFSLGNMKS